MNRRRFLTSGTLTASGAAVATAFGEPAAAAANPSRSAEPTEPLELTVNGHHRSFTADPRVSLLDALRHHLGMTGTKKGCDHGQCGACTVHIDGKRILSCLTLAAVVRSRPVTTIEGLSPDGMALHPMQQAFLDHDALQCGYCTPGQIMSGVACIAEGHAGTPVEIREYMSGNLCRCACYPNIVAAIEQARDAARAV